MPAIYKNRVRQRRKESIVVVGAGIGGLAVAAALRKFHIETTIYEQAATFDRVGAGIQQSPNATKVHRWLGTEERIRQAGFAPVSSLYRDGYSGKVTSQHPLGREVEARYGAAFLTLHRGDLHDALASIVPGETVRLGRKLTRIEAAGPRIELSFADGSEAEVDAVIGVDGVHSLLREHVAGAERARFTGRLAYRASFPTSLLRGIDIGRSRTTWRGRDRYVVIEHVNARLDEMHFTTNQPEKADCMTQESWSMTGDLGEMRAAFATFHSDLQRVLAAAPQVHKQGIYERDPLPAWSKGRVVLLGDACHPMTSGLAWGAAMALEDAVVLARSIDEADTLETAFRIYEATRKPRASMVQATSGTDTWMRGEANPDWLYGYDASRVPLRSSLAAESSTYYEA
jgi:salicylate hydroxylase/6-hydroxynicotinate 3-monooxygenase